MALARLGQLLEALGSFDRAVACAPDRVDAHANRGDTLAALGRHSEALASYALALAPGEVETWCSRGAVAQLHFNRSNALALLGRRVEAIAAYDLALAIDPGYLDPLQARSAVLLMLKRYDEAIAGYERILALDPGHPRALSELANCHLVTCDWSRMKQIAGELESSLVSGGAVASPRACLSVMTARASRSPAFPSGQMTAARCVRVWSVRSIASVTSDRWAIARSRSYCMISGSTLRSISKVTLKVRGPASSPIGRRQSRWRILAIRARLAWTSSTMSSRTGLFCRSTSSGSTASGSFTSR